MHTTVYNTVSKIELIEKNRVKNCLSCDKDLIPNDEKLKLKKYAKEYIDGKGYRTDYKFPEGKDFGRITQVPYTGLGTFCRQVRGYLANGVYIDVDCVNAHPVILQREFKKHGIDTSIIDDYINNREEFLERENISKKDFLTMINKEDFVSKSETLTKLHNQIYSLLVPIILKQNPSIAESIKKSRSNNKNGALVANYLQDIEFKILCQVSNFSEKNDIFIDVYMHDGFFVRLTDKIDENYINKEIIPKYEKLVSDLFEINMKFKVKPHDLSLVIPDLTNKTQLDIHVEALLSQAKSEGLRKSGKTVYAKKNNHPMYYEDYYAQYNMDHPKKKEEWPTT